MSEKIVQLNEEIIKGQIKELVRGSVEETLNELREKEAESLTQAARFVENRQPRAMPVEEKRLRTAPLGGAAREQIMYNNLRKLKIA